MIQATNVSKSYGDQLLLESISFNINAGERIGLVGRNGHGKTTLFRLILGEEELDSGSITIPRNYTIGYLDQHIRFQAETVLQEACLGLPPELRSETWRVEKLLSGLGFSESDFDRPLSEFSGGYQVRIKLARVLAQNPNLLLLDEPTNYLDIVSLRWLTRFLQGWKKELILITHDRSFMDSVCTHTMSIHRRKIRKIEGGTEKLYDQIIKEEEVYEKTRVNDDKRRKEIELFITRFRAKARLGGLVQSRVKLLEKQGQKDKLERVKTLEFSFTESPFIGKWMLEGENITFSYDGFEPYLINALSLRINKDDRIGIIGRNGKGKSTLLKLMAGILTPLEGEVKLHPQTQVGYFGQTNVDTLHPDHTIEEEILLSDPDRDRQKARDIAGGMLFEGDLALKKISVLSGGEKSRVMLGKILVRPTHLLLLDEPTNHLDMQSCDSLIAALDSYSGAVAIVTHNEMYLNALVNRLIVFDNNKITVFEGSYQDFLNEIGWASENEEREKNKEIPDNSKKAKRKARAEIQAEKNKVLKPLSIKLRELEDSIRKLEAELHRDNEMIIEASGKSDGAAISELARKIHQSKSKIDSLYEELTSASEAYEAEAAKFEEE